MTRTTIRFSSGVQHSSTQGNTMEAPSTKTARPLSATWLYHLGGFAAVAVCASWMRSIPFPPDPVLQGYLQLLAGLLAFVFAALTLVRFQGTQDRIALMLGAGFLLSGGVLAASSILYLPFLREMPSSLLSAPLAWWTSRMLLAILLLVAILVERFLPRSRHTKAEIAGTLLMVVALTYAITAALHHLPRAVSPHPHAAVPDPIQFLPAAVFFLALFFYRRRLHAGGASFDRAIYAAVWLNLAAQLAASQSLRLLDSPFVFAQALMVAGYAVALGGALLDNARLFEQVHQLATSDPLTGLANYRRLLDVLESETERTHRNGRAFSVLLLDLDGLKKINDSLGHLTGSRALCRTADVLRIHCRAMDTAARYGGDEFALVLPETQEDEARRVASRIREVMAKDQEPPPISASIGISVCYGVGERVEKLLADADENLYAEKARRRLRAPLTPVLRRRPPKN